MLGSQKRLDSGKSEINIINYLLLIERVLARLQGISRSEGNHHRPCEEVWV